MRKRDTGRCGRMLRVAFCAIMAAGFVTRAEAQTSTYAQVNLAGSFNGWDTESTRMILVSDNVWRLDLDVAETLFQFKFTTPGWASNWGKNSQPHQTLPMAGIADVNGTDIQVTNGTGSAVVRFLFNDQTRRYSLYAINNLFTNLLYNGSFETQGSTTLRARYWEWENPNQHGAVDGAVARVDTNWAPPAAQSGLAAAAILGTWAGQGSSGAWWQEVPVEPGLTYEASAHFYAEGAPNLWTAATTAVKLEFFDFNSTSLLSETTLDLSAVTNNWTFQSVEAIAPLAAAWARLVVYSVGNGGQGTFRIDNAGLSAIAEKRQEDFNDWIGTDTDGSYLLAGWMIVSGKTVSVVAGVGITNDLARSGLAASLANPSASSNGGGYVQSPQLQDGLGTVTFYYRHGHIYTTNEFDLGPDDPVRIEIQTSFGGEFWQTRSTIENIFSTDYVRYDLTLNEDLQRYVRIRHVGGSTNRVIIDDISISEISTSPRFMNFNTWPTNGVNPGFHDFLGWQVDTGVVSTANAKDGNSAQIFGSPGNPNFLMSPSFFGGYGPISFSYRRGADGENPVGFSLEASTNGTDWVVLDTVTNITSTVWQDYQRFFFVEEEHAIRIRNIIETNEPPTSAVLIEEPFNGGTEPPPGWEFNRIATYTSSGNFGDASPSLRFDTALATNYSWIQTPEIANPTNIQFWMKGQSMSGTSTFYVVGWHIVSNDWVAITNFSNLGSSVITPSFPVSTNFNRFWFYYLKQAGNMAFDDLLITGLPAITGEQPPQSLLLDDVLIDVPGEFRQQNFNSWPTKSSYANPNGITHQYWWIFNDVIIDSQNANEGQVARLRRQTTGPVNPYIESHFFKDGIGSIDFQYRAWPAASDTTVGFQVLASSNGVDWITLATELNIPNTHYTQFSMFLNSNDLHYVRIIQHAGNNNSRLLIDDISIPKPQPPANVLLSGWHDPDDPFTNDTVAIYGQTILQNGAFGINITSYYRIGTSGVFTTLPMQLESANLYVSVTNIAAQPSGTRVEYYITAHFSGPGGQAGSVTWPEGGATNAAFYIVPRNPPGSVWINEIDVWHQGFFEYNKEFIELAGVAGVDLTDWRIEIRDASTLDMDLEGEYTITNNVIIANTIGGFGFWWLGGDGFTNAPLPDQFLTHTLGDIPIGAVHLINEVGKVVQALSYGGSARFYSRIPADDPDFAFDDPQTNVVALVGTGNEYDHFEWVQTGPPTPGEINPNQFFGDPAMIEVSPTNLFYSYIAGSYSPPGQTIVVSNSGEAVLNYSIATNASWLSAAPSSGTLNPGEDVEITVYVNTTNRLGPLNGQVSIGGNAANSPQIVTVSASQVSLQSALLSYPFDTGSGGVALNQGAFGVPGNLTLSSANMWTLSGGGASSSSGDFAVQFATNTAHTATTNTVPPLNGLTRLTLTGWMKTTETSGTHRIAGNRASNHGFELLTSSDYGNLAFVSSSNSAPAAVVSTNAALNDGTWRFFALVYDSADAGDDALKFYSGTTSNNAALYATLAKGGLGGTGASTNRFFVGGTGTNAFSGLLDDIRVFTNALDEMSIEAVRLETANRVVEGQSAPVITSHPSNITVNIDNLAGFSVTATGNPSPSYQWRKNGTNISGAILSSYSIGNAQPSDAGNYDVVVQNIIGVQTSQIAVLTVNYPVEITVQPSNLYYYVGGNPLFSVTAVGHPRAYQWRKGTTNIVGATSTTYTINNVQMSHADTYRVVVTNQFGSVTSVVVSLTVRDPDEMGFDLTNTLGRVVSGSTTGVVIRWESASDWRYDVYWTTNIKAASPFVPIATNLPPTPPINAYTDTVHGVNRYGIYQIRMQPAP